MYINIQIHRNASQKCYYDIFLVNIKVGEIRLGILDLGKID